LDTSGTIPAGSGSAWKQIGFTFQPTGTTAIISIRNNGVGGAGNDWAIDDIYVGDCIPTVSLQPIITTCDAPATQAQAIITDASHFYDTYQWLIDKNDGNGYVAQGAVQTGTFDPVTNAYTATIALPAIGLSPGAYLGWQYQIAVGTTASDLSSPTCSYTSSQLLRIQNCSIILPVKFENIQAQLNNNSGEIQWQVAQQLNVKQYELQKSIDNKNFSTIAITAANISTSNYTAYDNNLSGGVNYYRIKEVDVNGAVTYSKIVALIGGGNSAVVTIFPNPVSSQLFIATPTGTKIINAVIIDAIGREVLRTNNINNSIIDAGNLAPGFYTIKMTTAKNEIVNKSFIKK